MDSLIKVLIVVAALAFVGAAVASIMQRTPVTGLTAEGLSRACTNLALLAIALTLWRKRPVT